MPRAADPLFPTDDGWPYPDPGAASGELPDRVAADTAEAVDLDALELRVDAGTWHELDDRQRRAVALRFGFDGGEPSSMRDVAADLGCTRAEAAEVVGSAIDLLRRRLSRP